MDRDTVRLIVKAPNQKIDDQVIHCNLDWSVLKLKEHLSDNYPCKPLVKDQRLIYSGHLLKDEQHLSDFLESSEDNTYTLHLVCRQKISETPKPSPGSVMSERNGSEDNSNSQTSSATNTSYMGYGVPWNNMMSPQMAAIPTAMALNPEQMMQQMAMMQQMYLQYMAQYFNEYGVNPQGSTAFLQQLASQNAFQDTVRTQTPGPVRAVGQQAQQPPRPVNVRAPAAAAGPVGAADDDDDPQNNDWLDWFYWLSRAMIFMSIVYFYSSLSRFVIVIGFGLLLYFYHNGYFNTQRNEQRQNRNREPGHDLNDAQRMQEMMDGNIDDHRQRNTGTENRPTEERFSVLRLIWILVSSLFTSLIPEQPAPVNLN